MEKLKEFYSPITIIDDVTINNKERIDSIKDIELVINKLNINDDLMVIAGDNLLDFSLGEFINYFENKKS